MPAHCQLSAEKSDEWTARRFEARPLSSARSDPARARYGLHGHVVAYGRHD